MDGPKVGLWDMDMTRLSLRHEGQTFSLVLFSHCHLSGYISVTPSTYGTPQETGASGRSFWGLQIESSQCLLSLISHLVVTAADLGK